MKQVLAWKFVLLLVQRRLSKGCEAFRHTIATMVALGVLVVSCGKPQSQGVCWGLTKEASYVHLWWYLAVHIVDGGKGLSEEEEVASQDILQLTQYSSESASTWAGIGSSLLKRYQHTYAIQDLESATTLIGLACDSTPYDHPLRSNRFNSLATCFGRRFERWGNIQDVNRALDLSSEAFRSCSRDSPDLPMYANCIGSFHGLRYQRFGLVDDLEAAISWIECAIRATPVHSIDSADLHSNLGAMMSWKYQLTGDESDLNQALQHSTVAVSEPYHRPNIVTSMTNLADLLASGDFENYPADARKSPEASKSAREESLHYLSQVWHCESAPQVDRLKAAEKASTQLNALGRWEESSELLVKAIELFSNIGSSMLYQEDQRYLLREFSSLGTYTAAVMFQAGSSILQILRVLEMSRGVMATLSLNLKGEMKRDVELGMSTMGRDFEAHTLGHCAIISGTSIPESQSLPWAKMDDTMSPEMSHGVMARLSLNLKGEMKRDVELGMSTLGRDFEARTVGHCAIVSETSIPESQSHPWAKMNDTMSPDFHMDAIKALTKKEADLQYPTFRMRSEATQATPKAETTALQTVGDRLLAQQFMDAAKLGPLVVVNESPIRCDAILVEGEKLSHVPLPKLNSRDITAWNEEFKMLRNNHFTDRETHISRQLEFLGWLWNTVTEPILGALGYLGRPTHGLLPRVWWILTGQLNQLPIHAAGQWSGAPDSSVAAGQWNGAPEASVMERVISSYSPSIKALIHSRQNPSVSYDRTLKHVVVAMHKTPDLATLDHAKEEVDWVARTLRVSRCPFLNNTIPLRNPTKRDVLNQIAEAHVFHFAGHGKANPVDPLSSCLVLDDYPLTVQDLINMERRPANHFLAFLSACETGLNSADDLRDESINMMSAFQIAGFRHTIGLLWEVEDRVAVEMAKEFYTELMKAGEVTDYTVAMCIHLAASRIMKESLRRSPEDFIGWATYVHSGA